MSEWHELQENENMWILNREDAAVSCNRCNKSHPQAVPRTTTVFSSGMCTCSLASWMLTAALCSGLHTYQKPAGCSQPPSAAAVCSGLCTFQKPTATLKKSCNYVFTNFYPNYLMSIYANWVDPANFSNLYILF